METIAILLLLSMLGASQQASPITPPPGGKPVTCQTREEEAEKFNQGGGLIGFVMREAPQGELLAGTWDKIFARDWGDSRAAIKKMEVAIGKPLDQAEESDAKKIADEFGVVVVVPSFASRGALNLYTEAAWPPPLPVAGMGLGVQAGAGAGARGLVARYSLVGDQAGKVRVMRCTVPRDADIQADHVARLAVSGQEVPGWLQSLMKTDPRIAKINLNENGKKLSRLLPLAPAAKE